MSTINFNDTIYVQEALQAFVASLTPLNVFSHDYSSYATAKGSAIIVPRVEVLTATTFNQDYTGTGGTINSITVNLNNHRIQTVDLTEDQMQNSSAATFQNFAAQQGIALAKIVLTDVWSTVTTTNFGTAVVTTSSANYTKTQIRAARLALRKRNVKTDMCGLVINEDAFDGILGDANVVQAMQYGGPEAIREGKIPRLLGMNLFPSNVIPSNSISLNGFIAHPDSIAVAMRRYGEAVPDGAYEAFEQVTDGDTGISMTYRRLFNKLTGKWHLSFETLFGYAVGLSLGLGVFTTPDA